MIQQKNIVDILDEFIAGFDLSLPVLSSSDDGTNTTIIVENVYHARPFLSVDVDGSDYTVVSVDYNANTIVLSGVIASPTIYTPPTPFYFHGTPIMTNSHISFLNDAEKVPMIYFYEIFKERLGDSLSSVRSADVRLFFLDVANFEDWNTDMHYINVITPQRRLLEYFISQLQTTNCTIKESDSFELVNHVNFGIYRDFEGHMKKIFNDNLSGIELRFTLNINIK